ncbi:recombinase family protein [Dactylosporangium cerinum]
MTQELPQLPAGTDAITFAFYGRVSTEDNQDPESSHGWQLSRAQALIHPRGGRIVAEFFDVGESRSMPWQRRRHANRLLAALRNPNRGFDAVVIGEPHRAFYGNQFGLTLPLFVHYGVQLWVPEIGGPIDPDNEAHELVMSVFGGMSKGERNRIKLRVRTAMASQTKLEGRFLGGRPPYGYTLETLGPHPNPAKAADGRHLHGLIPHEHTAPIVQRIFQEFLDGYGLFAIAERLTTDDIPSPSAQDPARNRHRTGIAWSKSAVRAILTNPRYTGQQVWNRQRSHEVLLDVDDVALGHTRVMRWNTEAQWVRSDRPAHIPIIDDETFELAQELLTRRRTVKGTAHRQHRTRHPYVFRGVVHCGVCQRRMQGQYSNGVAYYRCRYPQEYALANQIEHPRNVYLREDALVDPVDAWLAHLFDPTQRDHTIEMLTQTATGPAGPDPTREAANFTIAECDIKLQRYRAALEAGADPAVVTTWIAQVEQERAAAEALLAAGLGTATRQRRMSRDEISDLVAGLADAIAILRRADPADKAEVYRQLGMRLTYDPETQTVDVQTNVGRPPWGNGTCRRGT